MKSLSITLGKRVSKRSHGNAGPVPGNVAEATLATKPAVRACETPEFYAVNGCMHGKERRG